MHPPTRQRLVTTHHVEAHLTMRPPLVSGAPSLCRMYDDFPLQLGALAPYDLPRRGDDPSSTDTDQHVPRRGHQGEAGK
jgi:hypothetical protein